MIREFSDGIWYFAHPYTCKDDEGNYCSGGEEANFRLCCIRSAKLIEAGFIIFSPIAHSHPIHTAWPDFVGKQIHDMWYLIDNRIIDEVPFRGIIMAPKWETSKGCVCEKKRFENLNREVLYYNMLTYRNILTRYAEKVDGVENFG